ncbi:hypothetical protein NQ318_001061 [Aromia moschata]|uniref:Uncharacterized protein n=1 Tax=Aromia moschata TaxID=1265417 RepID=A0AAV8ZH32_9CUCU|nr:hypothetical protein NQ318_001061 [Aromia moschata]
MFCVPTFLGTPCLTLGEYLIEVFSLVSAGICWSAMVRNGSGRCTELLQEKISKEECCSGHSVTTSWSAEELDSATLFFWRILGGGVQCSSCRDSCEDVDCGVDKNCVIRKGYTEMRVFVEVQRREASTKRASLRQRWTQLSKHM